MKLTEMKDIAEKIIAAGFAEKKEHDDIKMDMFSAKIPFSKLNSLFRSICIAKGHIVDPKVVTEGITVEVAESDWVACETWEHVEAFVDQIVENVKGSTAARVLTLAKKFWKDEELEMPEPVKAPKASRARGGAIAKAIADAFAASDGQPTKAEVYDAVLPTVKGPKNAYDVMVMHFNLCYATANGLTLDEAIKATADQVIPQPEVTVETTDEAEATIDDSDEEILEEELIEDEEMS